MPGTSPCPCGAAAPYDRCCGRLHAGELQAPTAEALMRSRYSAFAVGDLAYLHATWHPLTRPARVADPGLRWTGLAVHRTTGGGPFDEEGTVAFTATYEGGAVDEVSRFVREGRAWRYLGPA